MVQDAQIVPGRDLPVDLGRVDVLVTKSRHLAQVACQCRQLAVVGCGCGCIR